MSNLNSLKHKPAISISFRQWAKSSHAGCIYQVTDTGKVSQAMESHHPLQGQIKEGDYLLSWNHTGDQTHLYMPLRIHDGGFRGNYSLIFQASGEIGIKTELEIKKEDFSELAYGRVILKGQIPEPEAI